MTKFSVDLSPIEAARVLTTHVATSEKGVKCVDNYHNASSDGRHVYMLVFEKFYQRNATVSSVSIVIENIGGSTTVCSVAAAGGRPTLLDLDFGAAKDIEGVAERAFRAHCQP